MAPLPRTSHDTKSLLVDTSMKSSSIQDSDSARVINTTSVSQNSSFTTNTGSALAPPSSSNSQTTFADITSTPPTSSEDPSSQSQGSQLSQPVESEASKGHKQPLRPMPKQSDLVKGGDTAKVGRMRTTPPRTVPALQLGIAGQKRTASGAVKATDASPPRSPTHGAATGSSKNRSIESSGHNISDLSAQLRTRLSYAMVKVQHGWESQSLDEVEAIASQQASPASLKGTMDHPPARQSPLATASWTSMSRQSSGLSEYSPRSPLPNANQKTVHEQDFLDVNGPRARPTGAARPVITSRSRGGGPLDSPSSNSITPTYESFWRDHGGTDTAASKRTLRGQQGNSQTNSATSRELLSTRQRSSTLAPAFSLIPSATRSRQSSQRNYERERSGNPQERDTLLSPTNALGRTSNVTSPTNSISTTIQATPPARPRPPFAESKRPSLLRTPSQTEKAAMEQDAVETLLYMSSPGGSRIHQVPTHTSASARFNHPRTPVPQTQLSSSTRIMSPRTPVTPIRTEKRSDISGKNDSQTTGRARKVLGKYSYRNRPVASMLKDVDIDDGEDYDREDDDIDRMLDAISSSSEED